MYARSKNLQDIQNDYIEVACEYVARLFINDDFDIFILAKAFVTEFEQADEYSPECLVFAKACGGIEAWPFAYAILDMDKEFNKWIQND